MDWCAIEPMLTSEVELEKGEKVVVASDVAK